MEGEKRQPGAGQFPFRPSLLQIPRPGWALRVPEAQEAQAEDSGLQRGEARTRADVRPRGAGWWGRIRNADEGAWFCLEE